MHMHEMVLEGVAGPCERHPTFRFHTYKLIRVYSCMVVTARLARVLAARGTLVYSVYTVNAAGYNVLAFPFAVGPSRAVVRPRLGRSQLWAKLGCSQLNHSSTVVQLTNSEEFANFRADL